jgi:hypothetical protein
MDARNGKSTGPAGLRDAGELLEAAVRETIDALTTAAEDAAAIKLALGYARTIDGCPDEAWAYRWIGPLLLDALEQLGATPAARARLKGGKSTTDAPVSQLAKLRAARRA